MLDANGIAAHLDVQEVEVAIVVGSGLDPDAGVLIGQGHGGFGNSAASLVANGSQHFGIFELCGEHAAQQ